MSVSDPDSETNGHVHCDINDKFLVTIAETLDDLNSSDENCNDASFIVKTAWADKATIEGSHIPEQRFWSTVKQKVQK